LVRSGVLICLLLAGCPKKPPPPAPAAAADAAVATVDDSGVDLDAAVAEPFDAWVPDHPKLALKIDWENRYGDGPRFEYSHAGLPALSPDGNHVVVSGSENERTQDPSFRLVTLGANDDREESSVLLQNIREYREAMYPPDIDYPTPAQTDPIFRKLGKQVDDRLATANATLANHHPLAPCKITKEGEAGVRLTAQCVGLEVLYEQHHIHVVGHGGHVRLDRSVAQWKSAPSALPAGYESHEEIRGIYGDATRNVLVFEMISVATRYYGVLAPRWHIVKLGP
jgi:hypothetical protein